MNNDQLTKFADFLLPSGDLKNREELRELLKDENNEIC